MDIGTGLAGGGITGAIMAALYVAYKCCYRKKFHSKCCGAEMDVQADAAAPVDIESPAPPPPTPPPSHPGSPKLTASRPSDDTAPPPLSLTA